MSIKILTIDDSRTIRLIVMKAFKPFDCSVVEAANGVVGLAAASREKPDIILLDYTMPVMDGFEVLARLRSDPDLKTIPVIMLTAEAGRDTVIKIAKLGVRDYLIKPFKEELLIERVGRVVSLKPKSAEVERAKRFDDPIHLLVVDDKPAITAQIRAGLTDTTWKVTSVEQPAEAGDVCTKQKVDAVLVSLSLPKDGAYTLYHTLREFAASAALPVFGLSVKTAVAEQARAQQAGFAGVITKPIDSEELKSKICRALGLETTYKYFQQRDANLVLVFPKEVSQGVAREISSSLIDRLTGTVDAGGDKFILDLSGLATAGLPVIELILAAVEACGKLSLKYALVGSDEIKANCHGFEETQGLPFAKSIEDALLSLTKP